VKLNFDKGLRKEALSGATNKGKEIRFVKLPPGNSRLDDPLVQIQDVKGFNYYYQGEKDNCLIGGLANAAFWLWGSATADLLLREYIPLTVNCWSSFVQHVQVSVKGCMVRKIDCKNVLEWDDQMPLVVQLRSCDKSKSHTICIFNGCIMIQQAVSSWSKTLKSLPGVPEYMGLSVTFVFTSWRRSLFQQVAIPRKNIVAMHSFHLQ
jgi:hypothetical protein